MVKIANDVTELIGNTPLVNISHLRCGPVGVRFIEPNDGRHKCRPYKDLKRKFLYNQVK